MPAMWYLVIGLIRSFYIVAAGGILIARLTPALRQRFLAYGARQDQGKNNKTEDIQRQQSVSSSSSSSSGSITKLLDYAATITVPHSWFTHFYIVSTLSALVWSILLSTDLVWSLAFAHYNHKSNYWQYKARGCLLFMLIHSLRRLYECIYVSKTSRSRMWVGHYLVGIGFYLVTNIGIWVDAVSFQSTATTLPSNSSIQPLTVLELVRVVLCLRQLFFSSRAQNIAHHYLSTLKTYQIPSHPLFDRLIAPHYSSEVSIYAALAVLATPRPGMVVNWTMVCALVFVGVNLGVTAEMTKEWQMKRFPEQREEILRRYNMIPGLW